MGTAPQTINLTATKAIMGVMTPIVFVVFFFFSLQSGVAENKEKIEGNSVSIEKMEARIESMSSLLHENNTNIKLIQLQMQYISEKLGSASRPTATDQ